MSGPEANIVIILMQGAGALLLLLVGFMLNTLRGKIDELAKTVTRIEISLGGYQTRDQHDDRCSLPELRDRLLRLETKLRMHRESKDDSRG